MNELEPSRLLLAYCHGVFPMGDGNVLRWYAPDPRAILPLANFHVSQRLRRTVNRKRFSLTVNHAFADVIHACAAPAEGREDTWITKPIIDAYLNLHQIGFAHSIESWYGRELVGGLYGVAIKGLFAGESMFSLARDSSKVALVHLVNRMKQRGMHLLDVQFLTPHLAQFGAVEITRSEYERRLHAALRAPVAFNDG